MSVLKLSGVTHSLPGMLGASEIIDVPSVAGLDLVATLAAFRSLDSVPDCIVGSLQSPAQEWLGALAVFPQTRVVLEEQGAWRDAFTAEPVGVELVRDDVALPDQAKTPERGDVELAEVDSYAAKTDEDVADSDQKTAAKQPKSLRQMAEEQLLREAFRLATWGADKAENQQKLDEIKQEAGSREIQKPGFTKRILAVIKQGVRAKKLWDEVLLTFKQQGDTDSFTEALEKLIKPFGWRTQSYIKFKLKGHREFLATIKQRQRKAKVDKAAVRAGKLPPGIETLQLATGQAHPNSIRHLAPAAVWDVLIDETGAEFDRQGEYIVGSTQGKVVALVVNANKPGLPPLKPGYHAKDESERSVDLTVASVIKAPVGVVGITVNDELAGSHTNWFHSIYRLMNLVLRLLPLKSGVDNHKVVFRIENRGPMDAGTNLSHLALVLQTEMRALSPIFEKLTVVLEIIGKEGHPLNGYVDAVAFTWGSNSQASSHRLRCSALAEHCLLSADADAIERLYAALDSQSLLKPEFWYRLVSVSDQEQGFLQEQLAILGSKVQQNVPVWKRYLEEVRQRLTSKVFRLPEVAGALTWLSSWQPEGCVMPPRLQLQWQSARLACANHLGDLALEAIYECDKLGEQLLSECGPEVCEADLRVAVAATNGYRFDLAQQALQRWTDDRVPVCGLRNWGKVLSSRGQHAAFTGQPVQAIDLFERAIRTFEQLSDDQEAAREIQQTRAYLVTAMMDCEETAFDALAGQWALYAGQPLGKAYVTDLAQSGEARRYEHHLLLRLFCLRPQSSREWIDVYLAQRDDWDEGENHPWPMIGFYRGMLLHACSDNEVIRQDARNWVADAVTLCGGTHQGPVLHWMGRVLSQLANAAGIEISLDTNSDVSLRSQLDAAPWTALDAIEPAAAGSLRSVMNHLSACLPFNFH